MAMDVTTNSLEERRLGLEERKAQQDYELRALELSLKRAESGWFSRFFTPLTTTILAGILTLAGSVAGTLMQGRSTLQLEREKFEANKTLESQKEQHELILKMVSVGDEKQARANLTFLAESKLIDDSLGSRILGLNDIAVLPSNTATRPSNRAFQAVRTDDEAIDLIIAWEGGFFLRPSPTQASNGGISLIELSTFLGRNATIDEVKNLSKSTIREIYKKIYAAPAARINAPLVRAAYFNFASWAGSTRAIRTLQTAAGRVLGKDITPDGILGPASISLLNSVPDQNLLVETADCVFLDDLKKDPLYQNFRNGWIERLRVFSPVVLHGVCPELQPIIPATAGADLGPSSAAPTAQDK
jgi:hypothetical protein